MVLDGFSDDDDDAATNWVLDCVTGAGLVGVALRECRLRASRIPAPIALLALDAEQATTFGR